MKLNKLIASLALPLSICLMVYAGGQLLETEHIYREAGTVYCSIQDQAWVNRASGLAYNPPANGGGLSKISAQAPSPGLGIDFKALKTINKDSAAWLYCPGTVIDYPVMQAEDYNYYLKHLPDDKSNANGSLFIDYHNAPDFSEPLTIIYGHNMKSGEMFGSLVGYKKQGYYEEHPYMYLYTEGGDYRVDLLYGCVIGAGSWRDQGFVLSENLDAFLTYAARNTTFRSDAAYAEGDRIVALSTCSYEFNDARYAVIGILRGVT